MVLHWHESFLRVHCQPVQREDLGPAVFTLVTAPAHHVTKWRDSVSVQQAHQDATVKTVSAYIFLYK